MGQNRISSAWIAWSGCGLGLLLFAGCGGESTNGGGGGGGDNSSTRVTFNFPKPAPIAVAAKIGAGAFTSQTLSSGTLSLSIPSGTSNFAVAYRCPALSPGSSQPTRTYQFVMEANTADGTNFTPAGCPSLPSGPDSPGTLSGTVDASAIAGVSTIIIGAQGSNAFLETGPFPPGDFSFSAPAGPDRVEVLAYKRETVGVSLVAARNFNGQAVPGQLNGGSPVVLGAVDGITLQPITYNGVPSGFPAPQTYSVLDIGAGQLLVSMGGTLNQYPALPSAAMETGDFYRVVSTSESKGQLVSAGVTTSRGGPVTIAFPVPWGYAGPTAAALPTFNFDYPGFAGKTGVIQTGFISWATGSQALAFFEVSATAKYQNGLTTIAMPDLSPLSGFLPVPASGAGMTWMADITQQSTGAFQPLAANTTTRAVENHGCLRVP